jgi:hypothetical protein
LNIRNTQPYFIILLTTLVVLCGCDPSSSNPNGISTQSIQKEVGNAIEQYIVQGKSVDELKKLHQFEYQVIHMPASTSALAIEGTLNKLGQDRWDCFHVEKLVTAEGERREMKYVFFCKRPPATPLRYVPRTLIGR